MEKGNDFLELYQKLDEYLRRNIEQATDLSSGLVIGFTPQNFAAHPLGHFGQVGPLESCR